MSEKLTRFFASRWGIVLAGAIIGILAPLLQYLGNPPNMGICVACFERDIAGALGLHRAGVVQYVRPEILGFVLVPPSRLCCSASSRPAPAPPPSFASCWACSP